MNTLSDQSPIWLHRFAVLVAGATFVLIFVGGLVTSTDSGLAVPDWPNTYGHFMISFPLSRMVGGILYEHGHRMVATIVGFLMTILAVWLWLKEPRKWVRWLGVIALLAVIAQGILGGITVLFLLPTPVSVGHATLAQTFFCLTIVLALFTSPRWPQLRPRLRDEHGLSLGNLTMVMTAAVYVQLILGAIMRHTKSGLAIPDFPLAFGRIIPPFTATGVIAPFSPEQVAIHFVHRLGALIVTVFVVWTAARVIRHHRQEALLRRPAILLTIALVTQLTLGAFAVWTRKAIIPTTAHVAVGALILATSLVIAVRAYRLVAVPERARAEAGMNGIAQEAG